VWLHAERVIDHVMSCLLSSVLAVTTALAAAFLAQLWLDSKSYVFEQHDIVTICEKAAGKWRKYMICDAKDASFFVQIPVVKCGLG
jgi:hypothetical protein